MLQLKFNNSDQLKCNYCLCLHNQFIDPWFQATVRKKCWKLELLFSATCTHRTASKSQEVKSLCKCVSFLTKPLSYCQVQMASVLAGLWGKAVLAHGSSHRRGQGEDLWTLEDFSVLWPVCSRPLPLPRQSPQSIPASYPACSPLIHVPSSLFASLLSLVLPLVLTKGITEYFATIIIVVVLFALTLFFTLSISSSLLSPNYSNEKYLFSSQFYGVLLLILSQNQCFPRAEIAALAHVCILMTSKIAPITKEKYLFSICYKL